MKFEFEYSSRSDVLSIYNYSISKPSETVQFSEYLNIDIDKDNKIIGLEIFDASEFFGTFNEEVDKEFLENLKEVEMEQKEIRNNWFLVIVFKSENKVVKQIMPPLRKSEYVSPLLA